jgi:molybdopterin converting factor small subunit
MVKAFGPIMDVLGRERVVELPEAARIEDLLRWLRGILDAQAEDVKASSSIRSEYTVMVNGQNVQAIGNLPLKDGDFVAVLSPFAGG